MLVYLDYSSGIKLHVAKLCILISTTDHDFLKIVAKYVLLQ